MLGEFNCDHSLEFSAFIPCCVFLAYTLFDIAAQKRQLLLLSLNKVTCSLQYSQSSQSKDIKTFVLYAHSLSVYYVGIPLCTKDTMAGSSQAYPHHIHENRYAILILYTIVCHRSTGVATVLWRNHRVVSFPLIYKETFGSNRKFYG